MGDDAVPSSGRCATVHIYPVELGPHILRPPTVGTVIKLNLIHC